MKNIIVIVAALVAALQVKADDIPREKFNLLGTVRQASNDIHDIEKKLADVRRKLDDAAKQEEAKAVQAVPATPIVDHLEKYFSARQKAIVEHKPLIVWVDCYCPPCVASMNDYVHVRVDSFPDFAGQGVVIGVPRNGSLDRVFAFTGIPSVEQVRGVVQQYMPPPAAVQQQPLVQQPQYQSLRPLANFLSYCVGNT